MKDGKLSGKLRNLVAYTRDGENLRRKAPNRTTPPTERELVNQYIFGLVQDWVTPLSPFLKRGFKNYGRKVYGANAAKSLIHRKALHRQGYDSTIDPSLVQVSAGKVALPENLQASQGADGQIHFSWDPKTVGNASPRDRIMLLAYNVEKKWPEYELSGPKRHEAAAQLSLAGNLSGTYHLYAAFVSEDGEEQSDSGYLGSLEK